MVRVIVVLVVAVSVNSSVIAEVVVVVGLCVYQ